MSVLQLSSMKTLRMRSSSMPHVGTLMGPNKRTLFWRCKKDASEREYIWYPYTRGSENPSEKSIKKLVWAPLLSELLYDIRTFGSFVHFFWRCKKRPLLSENTYDILTRAGPKTLPKKVYFFWNGVPEGSHSRPPGRSKSMAFERIFAGRKAPSDVWPGPPRCLVVTQEVSDVNRSLCKILMVIVEYHHSLISFSPQLYHIYASPLMTSLTSSNPY